ncbi:type II secretion system protein GspL [Aminirod propionatiphilus]|uniref:Uncharacterized protein n=1 Tax=Aminirod propionatiphilus TaxID=3415223 RepID=A0ACD1DYD4_9BACT|nr:hypothetical protein KIH16_04870 [Synergistota bacterium]
MADVPKICLARKDLLLELTGEGSRNLPSPSEGKGSLLVLCPFRTVAVHPFELPLSNLGQIREALRLRLQPFLAGGGLDLLPLVTASEGKKSRGVAWLVSRGERSQWAPPANGREVRLVPAVLALAALGGDGALLGDGDHLYSVALGDGQPLALRCQPRDRRDMEAEVAWLRQFLGDAEASIVSADLVADEPRALALIREGALKLLDPSHRLYGVDLSGQAIDAALRADRLLSLVRRAGWAVAATGLAASLLAASFLFLFRADLRDIQRRSESLYRETFGDDGVLRDPLSQARARLMTSPGGNAGPSLAEILSLVGESWSSGGAPVDVTLETLRYNAFGADVVGAAPDVRDIEGLQARLKTQGLDSRLGDIQQTPGGKLRFSLSLRWEQP